MNVPLNFPEFFFSLTILLGGLLTFIHLQNERQNKFSAGLQTALFEALNKLLTNTNETNNQSIGKFMESVSSIQIEHFRDLEKTSDKQLRLMEGHFTDFMKHLKDTEEMLISGNINNYYGAKNPQQAKDIITSEVENAIEKKETDEIPITDEMRIPIIDGVKVKFEDEEEILSPTIFPANNL